MRDANTKNPAPVVLVVEDEFFVRADISSFLRDAGCVVIESDSVEKALAVATSTPAIDVLFTDIQLNGGGSGLELAEKLRARQEKVGVVYASGNPVNKDRCVPGSIFFSKPYRSEAILEACIKLKI